MAHILLPRNPPEWEAAAKDGSLITSSLHSPSHSFKSGSKIEMKQYLLLRALWPNLRGRDDFGNDCRKEGWISAQDLKAAQNHLDPLKPWIAYLNSFKPNRIETIRNQANHGTLALARYYQHLTRKRTGDGNNFFLPKTHFVLEKQRFQPSLNETPTRRPRTPEDVKTPGSFGTTSSSDSEGEDEAIEIFNVPLSELATPASKSQPSALLKSVEDEQIVNTALILFLNAVTLHTTQDNHGEWTLYRQPFTVKHVDTKKKLFEARVDGMLRNKEKISAIIEVKPYERDSLSMGSKVQMQEAAQMAAWIAQPETLPKFSTNVPASIKISTSTNTTAAKHRRLLISQDYNEIYLIVASFDDNYVRYIQGTDAHSKTANKSFLTMQQYGPYVVDQIEDMKQLAPIILAFSLQGGLKAPVTV